MTDQAMMPDWSWRWGRRKKNLVQKKTAKAKFDFEKAAGVVSQYTGKEDGPAYEN